MRQSYDVLDALLRQLTDRLVSGDISLETYYVEFDRMLDFTGWTERQLMQEIDKRWSQKDRPRQAFLC